MVSIIEDPVKTIKHPVIFIRCEPSSIFLRVHDHTTCDRDFSHKKNVY